MFRRVDAKGRTIGEYLAEDIAAPLQAAVVVGVKKAVAGNYAPILYCTVLYCTVQVVTTPRSGRCRSPPSCSRL